MTKRPRRIRLVNAFLGAAFLTSLGCHSSVGSVVNPHLANVCSWSGKIQGVVNGICPEHQNGWQWNTEMTMYAPQPGEASLDACPITDEHYVSDVATPGWLLRVEKTLPFRLDDHATDHFVTQVLTTRLDGPSPCSLKLVWVLKQQGINLVSGTIVRFAMEYTIVDPEKDAYRTSLLRDDKGAVLVGWVGDIRPEVWNNYIWPEATLSFGSKPLCQRSGYADTFALNVTLAIGDDTCTLDSGTGRCCTFGGMPYEVLCPDAWHSSSGSRPDFAYLVVARQDLVVNLQ